MFTLFSVREEYNTVNIVHSDTGHSDTSAIATLFPGPEKVYYVLYRQLIGHSDRS